MSTPNDIQALLASIRPRPSPSNTPAQDTGMAPQYPQHYPHGYQPQHPYNGQSYTHPHLHQQAYRHPSVSSALHSPSPVNTPPRHGSDILSPNVLTPGEGYPPQHYQPQPQNPDRSNNLLNLLRFNQPQTTSIPQQTPPAAVEHTHPSVSGVEDAPRSHNRNISASDLVASLFGKQNQAPAAAPSGPPAGAQAAVQPAAEGPSTPSSAEKPQDMLLRLLNRGQEPSFPAAQTPPSVASQRNPFESEVPSSVTPSTHGVPEPSQSASQTLDGPSPLGAETIFTHVNPFEQLAAVSRNRTPLSKSRDQSPDLEVTATQQVNVTTTVEPLPTSENIRPKRAKSPVLADEQKQAVANVVGKLVEQITRDVDESYENMMLKNASSAPAAPEAYEESSKVTLVSATTAVQGANGETEVLKETIEEIAASAEVKETSNGSGEPLADSWESAEDSAEKDEERVVPVHNFPLKPFITIIVKPNAGKLPTLRDDGIMDIARLKKDFDQLDRSLTSATPDYIVYALAKNGGMRIIRQDDGSDKQVFRSTRDRVFSVAVCTSQSNGGSSDDQAILGIGVSGAVYWVLISRGDKDLFEQDALESESLIFPPFPASDENTSGGQLKTRAKRSSRHPGFFAIGRGKNIYVISPQAAASPAYGVSGDNRTVNTEKFFKERALKISTGKAGKDFIFSDDDTVIASLDKTGRLRFWDIRDAVNSPASGLTPSEIRVPLSTFVTGSPTEKSWPTSVLFMDKLRPYVKSMALRYVLVGLKQNHTLQLWDIGLGKAVQELKFPHENESDAICSVAYHASSGILVVGHPTRNSIYFVHLSAPRYNLQPMSQATFIKRAAEKDPNLPKPESTACLSGIREISFASKGQLRSLDLLPITKAAGEDSGLFELYVMHSRGVTCLNIKRDDLGMGPDQKALRPINALEQGFIEISDLQTFPSYVSDEPSVNGDSVSTPVKAVPKEFVKTTSEPAAESSTGTGPTILRAQSPTKPAPKKKEEPIDTAASVGTSEKPEKKKKKKGTATGENAKAKETPAVATNVLQPVVGQSEGPVKPVSAERIIGDSPETWNKHIEILQNGVTSEFNKSLGRELEGLYTRFDEERRSWDAASAAKQEQVLRLVSSTLSDNVEKNLTRVITETIKSEVVPALGGIVSAAVGKELNTVLSQQSGDIISRELRQSLPGSVTRALQQPDVMKVVTNAVSQKVESQIKSLHDSLTPTLKNLALQTAEQVGNDLEKRVQAQRQSDAAKIDELTTLVRGLSDTVSAMAAAQTGFQNEVLRLNQVLASFQGQEGRQGAAQSTASASPVPLTDNRSPEQIEITEIAELMRDGRYEEGSVRWLQSEQQAYLFDSLFVRLNPSYLNALSPIVALSVGVAVTSSLQTNVKERLSWLEVVLQTVNPNDPDIREVAPKIMDILIQRLDGLYMAVAKEAPHDPILRRIPPLSRRARELRG
ncbi:hypothetical protein ASPCAL08084 [Aspergillus calidoustus]|uniref:EDC4-like protein pdc1 beta-propeller domain-containing protein n=1 Tax=Aspergillus calidoustus TaxID=454130 RepID=A0A0U5GPF5_ASPCI|nr:hypothetical protein ASPCAL08084 [Aspergillus calidoustus]